MAKARVFVDPRVGISYRFDGKTVEATDSAGYSCKEVLSTSLQERLDAQGVPRALTAPLTKK